MDAGCQAVHDNILDPEDLRHSARDLHARDSLALPRLETGRGSLHHQPQSLMEPMPTLSNKPPGGQYLLKGLMSRDQVDIHRGVTAGSVELHRVPANHYRRQPSPRLTSRGEQGDKGEATIKRLLDSAKNSLELIPAQFAGWWRATGGAGGIRRRTAQPSFDLLGPESPATSDAARRQTPVAGHLVDGAVGQTEETRDLLDAPELFHTHNLAELGRNRKKPTHEMR